MTPENFLKARLSDVAERISQLEKNARESGDKDGAYANAISRKKAALTEIGEELKKLTPAKP